MTTIQLRKSIAFLFALIALTSFVSSSAFAVKPPAGPTITQATGNLRVTREYHTATLLPNGNVLVAAGYGRGGVLVPLASAELYDSASGTWTTTNHLASRRYHHTATLLPNGKVLVAGGETPEVLASAELYDPASGTWTTTRSLAN